MLRKPPGQSLLQNSKGEAWTSKLKLPNEPRRLLSVVDSVSETGNLPFIYVHPELNEPWRYSSATKGDAEKAFEDIWHLRVPEGLLEHVDGGFFDGETRPGETGQKNNLCAKDMTGHMWTDDDRPARTEFNSSPLSARVGKKPIVCILCGHAGWTGE